MPDGCTCSATLPAPICTRPSTCPASRCHRPSTCTPSSACHRSHLRALLPVIFKILLQHSECGLRACTLATRALALFRHALQLATQAQRLVPAAEGVRMEWRQVGLDWVAPSIRGTGRGEATRGAVDGLHCGMLSWHVCSAGHRRRCSKVARSD
eukprot:359814-Chlamydomonas_euryale.AAC.11